MLSVKRVEEKPGRSIAIVDPTRVYGSSRSFEFTRGSPPVTSSATRETHQRGSPSRARPARISGDRRSNERPLRVMSDDWCPEQPDNLGFLCSERMEFRRESAIFPRPRGLARFHGRRRCRLPLTRPSTVLLIGLSKVALLSLFRTLRVSFLLLSFFSFATASQFISISTLDVNVLMKRDRDDYLGKAQRNEVAGLFYLR